jgi:hypothetical protein
MTLDDYIKAIRLPSCGAVRASLGLASNRADIEHFAVFANEFVDLDDVPEDLPARTGCRAAAPALLSGSQPVSVLCRRASSAAARTTP